MHTETPGLVGGRGHHTARTESADDHRLSAQRRLRRLLGGGEEGIHVEMQDRRRGSHMFDAPPQH
jgi:hypothetical protein